MKGTLLSSLVCEKLVWGGKALARWNGQVVLVEGALAGETVEALVTRSRKDYLEARTTRVLVSSPERVTPRCYHFGVCGGCDWQYLSYAGQLKAKEEIFKEILLRQAGLSLETIAEPSPEEWGYRSRVQWHARGGEWEVYPKGGVEGEAMRECLVADPLLQDFLEHKYPPRASGRFGLTTSGEQVLTSWQGKTIGSLTLEGREIFFSVHGFFQNNRSLLAPWIDFVKGGLRGSTLWDLYGGVGILSAFLRDDFEKITLVETSLDSLELAYRNVAGAELIQADVLDFLKGQTTPAEAVIVNPPRVGLEREVVEEILRLSPTRLVYVSCNPTTLARDMRFLKELYDVESSRVFDFYPQTYHMEGVLHLRLRSKS